MIDVMFYVKQVRPRVFRVNFDSPREMSMAFFRYQEFYESRYDSIREKKFTMAQQMGLYCRDYLKDRDATWTWATDWDGFNAPAEVILQVHELGIPDPNHYDSLMLGIYWMIMAETQGKSAYVIGTFGGDENTTLDHEMTHAMFYIDDEYRRCVQLAIDSRPKLAAELVKCMNEQNYPDKTAIDEINAYISTGEAGFFDGIEDQVELDELRSELRTLHRSKFDMFVSEGVDEEDA